MQGDPHTEGQAGKGNSQSASLLQVTFRYTPDDLLAGIKNFRPWAWKFFYSGPLGLALLAFALLAAWPNPQKAVHTIPMFLLGMYFLASPLWIRWWVKRQFARDSSRDCDYTYEFTDAGGVAMSPNERTELPWSVFARWVEGNDVFVLVEGDRRFRAIPKRAFTTQQLQQFRDLLRRKLPKSRSSG